jgi:hypothetical protein
MRSATLRRSLTCGFRGNRLVHTNVAYYLTLVSQDRNNPGFSTQAPGMSQRFYLVCEGRVGTTLATFAAGEELSFDKNTFTLPCGHMIYRTGSTDPAQAERVSGQYAYRVRSATWQVRRGPTFTQPSFDVRVDVVVFNPLEVLHLSGRLLGELASTLTIVDCPQHQTSKQEPNPACR